MTTIYIAGKISGLPLCDASKKFHFAEVALVLDGYTPINPMKLPHKHDQSWKSFMKEDLRALKECEAIFVLPDWKNSRGARLEVWFAKRYNKTIIFQDGKLEASSRI